MKRSNQSRIASPTARRRSYQSKVSLGVEKIVFRAAMDPDFRSALLADRSRAIDEAGYELTASERTILLSVPEVTLSQMIARIRPQEHIRNPFAKSIAAIAFAAVATTGITTGCYPGETGSGPDPTPPDIAWDTRVDTGAETDVSDTEETTVAPDRDADAVEDADGSDAGETDEETTD